jgi:hypothetical protein
MRRISSRLGLALALGLLGTGCAPDSTAPTAPAVSFDRDGGSRGDDDRDERDEHDNRAVSYAVIGDAPYGVQAVADFPRLIAGINADPAVRRVIHVGDVKGGSDLCTDAAFEAVAARFTTFSDPLVFTPGDNDWTDCHRANNGGYNPLERLDKVREIFFANPGVTLGGRQVRIKAQRNYPENQTWMASDVVFSALHVIGSNNGRGAWFGDRAAPHTGETPAETASREAEWAARSAANLRWLDRTFEQAREERAKGVVLFMQADMWHPEDRMNPAISFEAHTAFVARLGQLARQFRRPVLIIAGDYHNYRVDAGVPWFSLYGVSPVANITQIIVDRSLEAASDATPIDYLRLTINPRTAAVFSWENVVVP